MKILLLFCFFISSSTFSQTLTNENTKDTTVVYRTTDVDKKPQLTRGMYTLSLFISKNFKIDESIKNKKIIIFSSFIIEPDGTMTNIKAFHVDFKDYLQGNMVTNLSSEDKINQLDQIESMKGEAVRVLKLFDRQWIPAKKDHKAVRCLYNYPINFTIE